MPSGLQIDFITNFQHSNTYHIITVSFTWVKIFNYFQNSTDESD